MRRITPPSILAAVFGGHFARREQTRDGKRLIPRLDRVLVEKIVAPTKSVGGILLPESAVSKVRARENALRSRRRVVVTPPRRFRSSSH